MSRILNEMLLRDLDRISVHFLPESLEASVCSDARKVILNEPLNCPPDVLWHAVLWFERAKWTHAGSIAESSLRIGMMIIADEIHDRMMAMEDNDPDGATYQTTEQLRGANRNLVCRWEEACRHHRMRWMAKQSGLEVSAAAPIRAEELQAAQEVGL